MNGSMSCEESLKRSIYLCPICLRKLWHNIKFDPLARFKALEKASDINDNFKETQEWYNSISEHLENIYAQEDITE